MTAYGACFLNVPSMCAFLSLPVAPALVHVPSTHRRLHLSAPRWSLPSPLVLRTCHASSEPSGERPAPRHGLSVPDSWGTLPSGTLCSSYSVSPTLPPPSIAPHLASLCTVSLVSSPSRTIPPPPGSPPRLSGWVRCALGSLFLTPLGPHLRRGWACPPNCTVRLLWSSPCP